MRRNQFSQRNRGVALILAMLVVVVSVVLSLSFHEAQVASTGIAQNVVKVARARGIAESGVKMAMPGTRPGVQRLTATTMGCVGATWRCKRHRRIRPWRSC